MVASICVKWLLLFKIREYLTVNEALSRKCVMKPGVMQGNIMAYLLY